MTHPLAPPLVLAVDGLGGVSVWAKTNTTKGTTTMTIATWITNDAKNVALWIRKDERYYREAVGALNRMATVSTAEYLIHYIFPTHTPDGAPFTRTNVLHALIGIS